MRRVSTADRLRWVMIVSAVEDSWRWRVSGGRERLTEVVVQKPPEAERVEIKLTKVLA